MRNTITFLTVLMSIILMSFAISDGYNIGDKATDFKLKNIDDKYVSLSDYKEAKGFIVIFTCNTCPYAKMYEDRIQQLHEKYALKGYPVIAINPNDPSMSRGDSFDNMKERAASKGFKFPYLFDDGQKVFPAYGATKTPHVYILDAKRYVRYIGTIDNNPQDASAANVNYIDLAITALEEGRDPDPGTTRAIGCGIKAKRA